jgi:hypothetical protein
MIGADRECRLDRRPALAQRQRQRMPAGGRHLGFGRIVASEIEVPNILANLVLRGWAVVQSDNVAEPDRHPRGGLCVRRARAVARRRC